MQTRVVGGIGVMIERRVAPVVENGGQKATSTHGGRIHLQDRMEIIAILCGLLLKISAGWVMV